MEIRMCKNCKHWIENKIVFGICEQISDNKNPGAAEVLIAFPKECDESKIDYQFETYAEFYCNMWKATLRAQQTEAIPFGPQEPPDDPRIFNRKQADGSYRPLAEFFDGENHDR
jgi:hypothetical protein